MPLPRVLAVLGSGETSPTMVTAHQQLFARLGADVPAVTLDTPYGFQENADELTERVRAFFQDSVGRAVEAVRFRSRAEAAADPVGHAEAMARLLAARWVFAGPGSPSYALRQWAGSPVTDALDARLALGGEGGAVVFASAAALTLGLVTVPVYEVYKVGEEPRWLDGLDVLARATGLRAAVVPHFDNTEGGTHDTRFCYLGEQRLRVLEEQLPEGAFVLGVDEHTGLVLDLDSGEGRVVGRGRVSVRAGGETWTLPAGGSVTLAELAEHGHSTLSPREAPSAEPFDFPVSGRQEVEQFDLSGSRRVSEQFDPSGSGRPKVELFATGAGAGGVSAAAVDAALAAGDVRGAVRVLLRLDADATTGAERETVRAAVARLGAYAADAPVDRAAEIGPYVDLLLELRSAARADQRFADADAVRDRLDSLGVEVRDTAAGAEWELRQ